MNYPVLKIQFFKAFISQVKECTFLVIWEKRLKYKEQKMTI